MNLILMILTTSLLCLSFSLSRTYASPGTVSFSYKSPSGWENIKRSGDTVVSKGILQLTGQNDKCGWATYNTNIPLVDSATGDLTSFTTHFSFIINSTLSDGYGLAFFISSNVQAVSTCDSNLGLFPEADYMDNPQNQMIAVEFDTFTDEWDPHFEHVGIDVNTIYSAAVHKYSEYDGMTNGTLAHAWVSYDAGDQTLNVSLNYHGSELPDHPILSYKINLAQLLPTTAAVGFSAANYYGEVHQILSWEFNSTTFESSIASPKAKSTVALVAALCSIGAIFLLGAIGWLLIRRRKQSQNEGSINYNQYPKKFSYDELVTATMNFAPKNKLGEGGFGLVFKGYLSNCYDEVAVKLLKPGAEQGTKEFNSEVQILSKLRHPNLVELFGWCEENNQLLLVYKYMPNGSLSSLLSDMNRLLLWPRRYAIVLNLADALCYLQVENEFNKEVIHRDIKPENVLLDSKLEAKLSDFGLARPVDPGVSAHTTMLAGSRGYVAPELFEFAGYGTSKPSKQSDIYSFGIVLLEIACGRRNVDRDITLYVWQHYCRNDLLRVADERLKGDYDVQEMERVIFVGLWCAHPTASERPTIEIARKALKFENCELPPLSNYPRLLSGGPSTGSSTATTTTELSSSVWPAR